MIRSLEIMHMSSILVAVMDSNYFLILLYFQQYLIGLTRHYEDLSNERFNLNWNKFQKVDLPWLKILYAECMLMRRTRSISMNCMKPHTTFAVRTALKRSSSLKQK